MAIPIPPPRARDGSCFIAASVAGKQALSGKLTLVDVRGAEDFERYRIPGSLNVPLHLVKTKHFLKTVPVVLINEGRSTSALESACSELKKIGFTNVKVLRGGLSAWRVAGGSTEGDTEVERALNRMSPEELFAEGGYDDWLVLDVSSGAARDRKKLLPQAVVLGKANDGAAFIAAVKSAVEKKKKSTPDSNVLFISETGADYARIERAAKRAGVANAYYLQGGWAGYKNFHANQIAMWKQADQPASAPACRG